MTCPTCGCTGHTGVQVPITPGATIAIAVGPRTAMPCGPACYQQALGPPASGFVAIHAPGCLGTYQVVSTYVRPAGPAPPAPPREA